MSTVDRRRLRTVVWITVMSIGAVVVGWLGFQSQQQADRVDVLAEALADEQEAAEGRGEEPVAPGPSELIDDPTYSPQPGPKGDRGEPGRGIVDVECVDGTWIVEYSDGTVDGDAGDCTGDRGPTGAPGSNGVDGAAGSPGPPGEDGVDGQDGEDGRGIESAECDPDTGRWVIEYSDGTTDNDAGPCRRF